MVLVDTSVFIPFLKNIETIETKKLDEIIERGVPYGINPFIYQELLQGVRTEKEFELLKGYLDTQRFYDLKNGKDSFAAAARMFYNCQKAGITIRKGIDLLIAQTAIENNLQILHNDRDFTQLKIVEKRLSIY